MPHPEVKVIAEKFALLESVLDERGRETGTQLE
jgi:hypothetical protein